MVNAYKQMNDKDQQQQQQQQQKQKQQQQQQQQHTSSLTQGLRSPWHCSHGASTSVALHFLQASWIRGTIRRKWTPVMCPMIVASGAAACAFRINSTWCEVKRKSPNCSAVPFHSFAISAEAGEDDEDEIAAPALADDDVDEEDDEDDETEEAVAAGSLAMRARFCSDSTTRSTGTPSPPFATPLPMIAVGMSCRQNTRRLRANTSPLRNVCDA
jgi:hypothetical protein